MESRYSKVLKAKITEHRQKLLEAMGAGVDAPVYLHLVGQVQGLDEAVKLADDVDFELSGGS